MWLFSLVLAGGLGMAPATSPERLLYPTQAERLQNCRTPDTPTTEADLRAARERAGQRQVWFRPPAEALRGACTRLDPRYPAIVRAAQDFDRMLSSGEAPPAPVGVTLWAPIRDFGEVAGWRAWLVLRDGSGKEVLRWTPRTGMNRQLVPGMGMSMLIFDPPAEAQRALVRQATALWVEVDWGDGRPPTRYNAASLPSS